MSWFKRSAQSHIPAVPEDRQRNELLGSAASQHSQPPRFSQESRYPPSYKTQSSDPARDELFAGSRAAPMDSRYGAGAGGAQPDPYGGTEDSYGNGNGNGNGNGYGGDGYGEEVAPADEDEQIEGIKQQTRFIKQESLSSTRNALRIARETEETATNTLVRLGDQSERIADTERHLDMAKAHSNRAEDRMAELKQLNRSIFRPVVTWNKDKKRRQEEQRIHDRHAAERDEREAAHRDVFETRNRVEGALDPRHRADTGPVAGQRAARLAERSRFQFEATESDDELEDELDGNLTEIGDVVGRLKRLATAAGEEVDTQNDRLENIGGKVTKVDDKIFRNTEKLKRYH